MFETTPAIMRSGPTGVKLAVVRTFPSPSSTR